LEELRYEWNRKKNTSRFLQEKIYL
jgi:hypothetical protein